MDNLQPLLTGDNSFSDISVFFSKKDNAVLLLLGLALLERFRKDPNDIRYKMAIGRLVNLGFPIRKLKEVFGHDHRTLADWGRGLRVNDPEECCRIYAGRRGKAKITPAIEDSVRFLYRVLGKTVPKFRVMIQAEIRHCFQVKVCGECLRRIFRRVDAEDAAAAAEKKAAPPAVPEAAAIASPGTTQSPLPTVTPVLPPFPPPPERLSAEIEQTIVEMVVAPTPVVEPPPHVQPFLPFLCEVSPIAMEEASAPVPAKSQLPEETVPHPPATTPAPVAPKPLDIGGDGCEPAPVSGTDSAGSRNKSTTPVERLLPLSGGLPRRGREFLHHAGQILFYPWMEQVDRDRPAEWRIQRQWLGQVLQGALNIEQSKGVAGNELARFTGTRPLTIDTQRDHLQAAVVDPEVPEWLYRANNRIVPDGPGSGWTFFLDPCGKECTTDLPFLKGWCGRIHDTAKVLYMDCIHTRSGFPVYVRHYDNFYDLRDRVLMTLDGFNKLFPVGDQGDRVLIIDRAIFGLESFPRIREKGWGVVTWEKGYAGDGWVEGGPTVVCTLVRKRNNSSDDRVYRFEFQESRWKRDPSVRRLIVRATNPEGRLIEVSVLCSSLLLAAAEAVLGIFSRWLQENDFRQLDLHFGFMAITSYRIEFYRDLVGILQDRPVESIEFRELRHRVAELRRAQEKELFGRERLLDALEKAETEAAPLAVELQRAATRLGAGIRQIESGETTEPGLVAKLENVLKGCKEQLRLLKRFGRSKPKLTEKLEKLEGSIAARKLELAGLEKQLETVVREDSRLRLLVEMGAVRPDTRAKAVMDAVKVTGRNLFACLLVEFRKHYDNRRDDAVILRLLTRAEGVLRFTGETLEVGLWIKGSLGETTRKAVAGFLAVISARINERCRGQFVAVEVKLLDGPPRS